MNKKKILAAFAASVLGCSAMPVSSAAFAESNTPAESETENTGVNFAAENFGDHIRITGYSGSAESAVIPNEFNGIPVTSIAKLECDGSISKLILPASITEIADGAFENVTNLSSVEVDEANPNYSSADGVLYNKDMTKLILYPYAKTNTSFTVPDTVTEIGENAIASIIALEELTLGNGITDVNSTIFSNCSKLKKLVIPASVQSIDTDYIKSNASLEEYSVSEDNSVFSSTDGILFSKDGSILISCPDKISSVSYAVPSSVSTIAENAFAGTNIVTIDVPDNVTTLEKGAFSSMESLATIILGNGIKEISENTFAGDAALISVILKSAESINNNAFADCTSLKSITVPANTADISKSAFNGCSLLSDITVSENNKVYSSIDGILMNKNADTLIMYPLGKTAADYTVPDCVVTLADGAFTNCAALKTLKLGASFSNFEGNPFSGNTKIAEFYVADGNEKLTSIDGAVYSADKKVLVRFPAGREVGSFTLSSEAESFDVNSLTDCKNITAFIVPEDNQSLSSDNGVVFSKDGKNLVKYPAAAEQDIYSVPSDVMKISENAFQNVINLEAISFTNAETEISSEALSNMNPYLVIYGITGSTAEAFADSNNYEFISTDGIYKFGDVNGDGNIDALDASDVLTVYASVATGHRNKFIPKQKLAADIDLDKEINALDASYILMYYAYTATTEDETILSLAEYYSVDDPTVEIDEKAAAYSVGNFLLQSVNDGKIEAGKDITKDQILELAGQDSDVYKSVCKADLTYMYVLNENTALISTGAVFQGIEGYLITNSDTIKENSEIEVLGQMFDGDKIDVLDKLDGYSDLYLWSAGL